VKTWLRRWALVRAFRLYLGDVATVGEDEVTFDKADLRDIAGFCESPAGEKLMRHLEHRRADYDAAAVVSSTPADAAALCHRARGFRLCLAEIKRFSAARPSRANHEPDGPALPAELEHLRA